MPTLLSTAWQGVRSRPGRSILTSLSLLVGVLAIVVIQAGAQAARAAVLEQSLLTQGRAITLAIQIPGAAPLDNATRLRRLLSTELGDGIGSSALAIESEATAQNEILGVCFFDGDLRSIRPFPVNAGSWPTASVGLELPLAVNEVAALQLELLPGATTLLRLGETGEQVTCVVRGVIEDGQQEPRAYAPLPTSAPWVHELVSTGPVSLLVQSPNADETRLRRLAEVEFRRVFGEDSTPLVERLDREAALARQLTSVGLIFSIVGGLSLFVGALGILNIGLATLRERSDELCLRRSFGATRAHVVAMIVIEGQIIAIAASVLALGVGALVFPAATSLVSNGLQLTMAEFPLKSALAGVVAGCSAALAGSLAPAIRAGRVPIASMMRN